ncbi:MAG TPA: prepilin-type N-terminal cleavage/methylation domain-containing protein [Fredinandcohnia sp.]|nr:prepilin-type N-terminal cleavage/methylation domain-containing protein [Fredinandcohnia sp.]
MRARRDRGFTVTELMVTVGIVAILATVAIWEIQRSVPNYRVSAAASRFLLDLRTTSALAARTNRPVIFRVDVDQPGCALRYVIEQDDTVFQEVCLTSEYRGIETVNDLEEIRCKDEEDLGLAPLPKCSLCDGGAMVFLPTGEVQSSEPVGDTIVFRSADSEKSLVRAVGLRTGGIGRSRSYQWNEGAKEWICP